MGRTTFLKLAKLQHSPINFIYYYQLIIFNLYDLCNVGRNIGCIMLDFEMRKLVETFQEL